MGNQRTFASLAWNGKGKVTRRERFLAEMDAVIPWSRLVRLIEPHYPKAGQGRKPLGLEKMLRIYFLQQWFNLSDPQAEDAIYDSESMRRFAGVELGDEVVPDESTILRFRHLLERHALTHAIFDAVADLLEERRLLLRAGTIVGATLIAARSSTKKARASRDPEMKQTRKGRNWHFGMKLHIGTDRRGIVHTVRATPMPAYLTLRNYLTSSTDKSERCSAIKRTGRKTIEGFSRGGGCATGSTGGLRQSGR